MTQHPDIVILGGGVVGLTTAHFLSQRKLQVEVLDKGDLGQESSWAGAGIVSPAPEPHLTRTPLEALHALSLPLLARLSRDFREQLGVDNGYLDCGGLQLLEPDEEENARRHWQQADIAFEEKADRDLRQLEPALSPRITRAFSLPETAQIRNPRHVRALLAWCGMHNVRLRSGCPALGFERHGAKITAVRTAHGPISAAKFLVAAGAWSDPLLDSVGCRLRIRPVRGQIALLNTREPLFRRVVERGKHYLVPRPDGRVLVGSTEEDADFDKRTTAEAIQNLLAFATALVPGLASAHLERCWAGLRPGTPDGLPFLGRVPGLDNLFVAAGHFRSGIMLSTGTGQVMAELMTGHPPSVPLEAFRLDR